MFALTEQSRGKDDVRGGGSKKRSFCYIGVRFEKFIITFLLMLPMCVQTCDLVVKIQPEKISYQPITVTKDRTICFEDSNERIPIILTDLIRESRYHLAYYTSEYELSSCTAPQQCLEGTETIFEDRGTSCFLTEKQYDNATQNMCQECKNQSGQKCAYYTLSERRGELVRIWRKSSDHSELKFTLAGLNSQRQSQSNFLACDISWMDSKNTTTLAVKAAFETIVSYSVLRYKDDFYYIESSEPGRPENGKIGDYQVNVDSGKTLFANSQNPCEDHVSCPCNCSVRQESAMGSFLSEIKNFSRVFGAVKMLRNGTLVDVTDSQIKNVSLNSESVGMLVRQIRCKVGLLDSVPKEGIPTKIAESSQNGGLQEIHILVAIYILFIVFAIIGFLIFTQLGRNCLLVWCICQNFNFCSSSHSDRGGVDASDGCCGGCFTPAGVGEGDGGSSGGCCDCGGTGGGNMSSDGTGGGNSSDDGCCDCDGSDAVGYVGDGGCCDCDGDCGDGCCDAGDVADCSCDCF